jgi:hypothetical protein
VQYILDQRMAAEPGTTFDYNSGNPHLLSAILAKVTGKSALDYAKAKLFAPLGIDDVQWRHDPQGVSTGGFGLYLQPRDMAKLGYLWLRGGTWEGRQILPRQWLETARHASVDMGLGFDLHYGNLFWSIPSKDVYMAVGFHRQLIVPMPSLEIVAVFTGAARYSNAVGAPSRPSYPLGAVLNKLKGSVQSDTALAGSTEGAAALSGAIERVAHQARTEAGGSQPLAAEISSKVYRLKPNELRFQSFSLSFEGDGASYAYEVGDQRQGGPIGLDGLYRIGGRRLYGPSAAKGRWLDDKTFQLELQTVGNDDAAIAELMFVGKSVGIRVDSMNGPKFSLSGEASS